MTRISKWLSPTLRIARHSDLISSGKTGWADETPALTATMPFTVGGRHSRGLGLVVISAGDNAGPVRHDTGRPRSSLRTADRGATHDHFLATREYLVRHIAALMAAIGGNLGPCRLASAG